MAHVFPYSDFVGFAQDATTKLYEPGTLTDRYNELFGCSGCPDIDNCYGYYFRCFEPTTISSLKRMPDAGWFRALQAYIQILYSIKLPIPAYNYIYNANGTCENFVDTIATFEVSSASGQEATLLKGGVDPKACTPGTWYESPSWPLEGARWLPSGDGNGSLQQFDYVTFVNSPLAARGVKTFVESLTDIDSNSFSVRCPINIDSADISLDENPCYMRFHRRIATLPLWDNPIESHVFRGTWYEGMVERRIELPNYITIPYIMYPKCFRIMIGGHDISSEILSNSRFDYYGGSTRIYLGATNWDGSSVTNLWALYEGDVYYSIYGYDGSSNCVLGQMICDNCKVTGRLNNWGDGVANHGDFSCYCSERNNAPSALSTFADNCYQPYCDKYVERTLSDSSMGRSWIVEFLNNIWLAQDWYGEQAQAGTHTYFLYTKKHPSIMSLWGHFRLIAPTSYRSKKFVEDNGIYRTFDKVGCLYNADYEDYATYGYLIGSDYITNNIPDDMKGQVFNNVIGWTTCKNCYDYSLSSTNYFDILLPKNQKAGYNQESMVVSGNGEDHFMRGGEISGLTILSKVVKQLGLFENQLSTSYYGSYDEWGTSDATGIYGAKIMVKTGYPEYNDTAIVTGSVYAATREDANRIKIECNLAVKTVGKNTGGGDDTYKFMSGGNVVEATDPQKVNNYYCGNTYGSNQKARPGMSFHFTTDSELWFTIDTAYPCSGTRLSYVPNSITAPFFAQSPYYALAAGQIPTDIIALCPVGGNVQMYRAILAYCPTCDREEKFLNVGANWVCQNCAYSTGTEPTITGRPPGYWVVGADGVTEARALAMELEADEYFYDPIYDENQELIENRIYFSAWILSILEGPDYKVRISIAGNGTVDYQPLTQEDIDYEITEDQYATLDDDESYIAVVDGEDIIYFTETDDAVTSNWWSSETDGRKRFYKYYDEVGGTYWIRIHPDFLGYTLKLYFPQDPPVGMDSDTYYDTFIAGNPGLPLNHKTWACMADLLYIYDHGRISDPTILNGLSFTVNMKSIIHDSSTLTVKTFQKGNRAATLTTLNTSDYIVNHAMGMVLIKKTAIPSYPIFCVEIS